ncbi:Unknown protein sequence [Pseudomonas amygdali pv. mellea]|nr:Unknown protein sequence [Pseudomonas amygdali pv. mellea]
MDKTYQPYAIETSWYQTWEPENLFRSARRSRQLHRKRSPTLMHCFI